MAKGKGKVSDNHLEVGADLVPVKFSNEFLELPDDIRQFIEMKQKELRDFTSRINMDLQLALTFYLKGSGIILGPDDVITLSEDNTRIFIKRVK